MKRAYLVTGPESAGNRLLAAILVRAGCHGEAATFQEWDQTLPTTKTPAVVIRSAPHGDRWPGLSSDILVLEARGYEVTAIVTARDPWALANSQVRWGHTDSVPAALLAARSAYLWIFAEFANWGGRILVVPMEGLILHGDRATKRLLELLDLPQVTDGPLVIDGVEQEGVFDANARHYGG